MSPVYIDHLHTSFVFYTRHLDHVSQPRWSYGIVYEHQIRLHLVTKILCQPCPLTLLLFSSLALLLYTSDIHLSSVSGSLTTLFLFLSIPAQQTHHLIASSPLSHTPISYHPHSKPSLQPLETASQTPTALSNPATTPSKTAQTASLPPPTGTHRALRPVF